MNDWAQTAGTLAWTPELNPGCASCGFVFPDDEALVQKEFEDNLPFALSVARSAANPSQPKSSVGLSAKPFYLKSDDPFKDGTPGANFVFTKSYGDPQVVATVASAAIRTDRSLLLGFGLEQVDTAENRATIIGRAMQDLLG